MKTLQRVDLQVFSSSDCSKLHTKKIHFTNICGGVIGGYKSQCLGNGLERFRFIEVTFYLLHFTFNVLLQEIQVNREEFIIGVGFIY
jgi:hypothetical protein